MIDGNLSHVSNASLVIFGNSSGRNIDIRLRQPETIKYDNLELFLRYNELKRFDAHDNEVNPLFQLTSNSVRLLLLQFKNERALFKTSMETYFTEKYSDLETVVQVKLDNPDPMVPYQSSQQTIEENESVFGG